MVEDFSQRKQFLTFTRRRNVCLTNICQNFTVTNDSNTDFVRTAFEANRNNHFILDIFSFLEI